MMINNYIISQIRKQLDIYPIPGWSKIKYNLYIQLIDVKLQNLSDINFYQINNGFMLFLQSLWILRTYNSYPKIINNNNQQIDRDVLFNTISIDFNFTSKNIIINSNNSNVIFIDLDYNSQVYKNILRSNANYIQLNINNLYEQYEKQIKIKDILEPVNIVNAIFNTLENIR